MRFHTQIKKKKTFSIQNKSHIISFLQIQHNNKIHQEVDVNYHLYFND